MSNPIHQKMTVEETHINLFYFFERAPDPQHGYWKELAKVLPQALLPEDHSEASGNFPFWEQASPTLSEDLLPNITGLFQPGDKQAIETWALKSHVLALINGARRARGGDKPALAPVIYLSPVACRRLEAGGCEVAAPRLLIQHVFYYRFRTGMAVVMVDLRLTNNHVTGGLLQEAVHALTRFNALGWQEYDSPMPTLSTRERNEAPTMGAVVRALLGCKSQKHRRVYSHVYARVSAKAAKPDDYLVHLARHYTSDYRFSGEMGETILMGDFENVRHCIANEGMATLVLTDDSSPEFITDYYNKVTQQAHLPICLLNYHAEHAIQHFMSRATVWLEGGKPPRLDSSEMLEQQRNLVNFDSHFFLPVVSKINTHNRLHRGMQKIKYLDQQHQVVSRMTQLINSLMMAERKSMEAEVIRRRNLTYCRWSTWGIAAAAYLTVFSIVSETLEVLEEEWLVGHVPGWMEHWGGSISLFLAIAVSLISLAWGWRRCNSQQEEEHEDELTEKVLEFLHIHHLNKK